MNSCKEKVSNPAGLLFWVLQSRRTLNLKNRVDDVTENAVLTHAIAFPAHGQSRSSNEFQKQRIFVSASGLHSIWLRHGLENFKSD